MSRPSLTLAGAVAAALLAPASALAAPAPVSLSRGDWQVRSERSSGAPAQPPPPEETQPGGGAGVGTGAPPGPTVTQPGPWEPTRVPSVFDARALPALYAGTVKRYRLRFHAPRASGVRWMVVFEEVRRRASVFLNGRRIGGNRDPYVPFSLDARGLRPGRVNTLDVVVDNRKDPRLREGWWNWGGIVRPIHLVPVGRAALEDIGWLSDVRCRTGGQGCRATLVVDAWLRKRGAGRIRPTALVRLRSPSGQVVEKSFRLRRQAAARRRVRLRMRVPAPRLWSPAHPRLYSAQLALSEGGRVEQVERRRVGLRSMQVRRGLLYLNGRPVQLRGASIHEDMPGDGAALSRADMNRIVADLKALHANVTRAHYLLSEGLLRRLDRAGIMVWSQAPIWQRDRSPSLLRTPAQRSAAWSTVRRTVIAGRSHPSVIAHSVGNELSFEPDRNPSTRRYMEVAARIVRDLDPTVPVAIDINGRPGHPEQFSYHSFDAIGINQYFGWYPWVADFELLGPFLREMRELYPDHALVMTEFGAEGRPSMANAPPDQLGGYAFQAMHAGRTLDLVDRTRFLSGAIYWTLREFEIAPGWTGGAPAPPRNTRHNKGLLTYDGQRKPAWYVVRDDFARTPLYRR